jgi:hypothetical protein
MALRADMAKLEMRVDVMELSAVLASLHRLTGRSPAYGDT